MTHCHPLISGLARARALVVFLLLLPVAALPAALTQAEIEELIALLPPPPADDSPAGRADLETVLQVQADRTPEQVERAVRVDQQTAMLMGQAAFGDWFNAENLPLTAAFFRTVYRHAHPVLLGAKNRWLRPRPFVRDARVQPVAEKTPNTSYPSGHSGQGGLWATFYAAAWPAYRDIFFAEARESMWGRVLGGAHYPTDTQAGSMIGEIIAQRLLEKAEVQAAFREAQEEIRAFMAENNLRYPDPPQPAPAP
jgi:acid phosphatase (class A)